MPPTPESVRQILVIVSEWNVNKVLKAFYRGKIISLTRIDPGISNRNQS